MRGLLLIAVVMMIAAMASPVVAGPNLNGPTGLILIPSAHVEPGVGMHTLDGRKTYKYNIALPGGRFEAGVVRDAGGNDQSYNVKLALMNESWMLPALSLGAWDISSRDREVSTYLVASRNFSMIGLGMHGGILRRGRVNNLAALFNANSPLTLFGDLGRDCTVAFAGVEYSMLPLVTLMGEYVDKTVNMGIRFRPTEGVTIDWDYLDVRNKRNWKDRRLVNLKYHLRF